MPHGDMMLAGAFGMLRAKIVDESQNSDEQHDGCRRVDSKPGRTAAERPKNWSELNFDDKS